MGKTRSKAFVSFVGSIVFGMLGLWALIQIFSFQKAGGATTYVWSSVFPRIMSVGLLIFSAALLVIVYSILNQRKINKREAANRAAAQQ